MRTTSDFFGLLAYLTLMYGKLPDRDMLDAAYAGTNDEPREQARGHLALVPPPEPPPAEPEQATAAAA